MKYGRGFVVVVVVVVVVWRRGGRYRGRERSYKNERFPSMFFFFSVKQKLCGSPELNFALWCYFVF